MRAPEGGSDLRRLLPIACAFLVGACVQVTPPPAPSAPAVLLDETTAATAAPTPPGEERPAAKRARAASDPGKACKDVAASFYAVAHYRDQGLDQEQQIALAQKRVGTRDAAGAFRHWLRIIDFVYARPDLTAKQIAGTVLENCRVNDRGEAVVEPHWPAPTPARDTTHAEDQAG